MTATDALADVREERARQNSKWGEQNHPDGTGPDVSPLVGIGQATPRSAFRDFVVEILTAEQLALYATKATDTNAHRGTVTWADILLEEVFEALAESNTLPLRTELIQVAAVATQWVEAIDRRKES